jgi:hypothetical protein
MFEVGIEEGCKGKKSVKENKNRQIRNRILKEAKKVRAKRIAEAAKKKSAKKLTESKRRKLTEATNWDELRAEIESYISNLSDGDKIWLWNNYCDETNSIDYNVYSMDDLDEILADMKPWDAIRAAFYGDFNPNHNYWRFNGYGNLESFDYADDYVDVDEMVDYIIEDNDLDDDRIRALLDEATEEVDESLGEDFERVELETDDSVIKVTEEPKEEEDFSDVDFTDFSSIDFDDEPIKEESTDEEEVEAEEEEEPIGESVKKKSGKRLQENKAKIAKVRPVKEDFERVELETEDKVIKVSEEPKEETPDAEMIEPLDLNTEADIVGATNEDNEYEEEAEGGEEDFIDQDFDEFEEEDFDELGESYLKRVYDNVKSFKTSKVSTKGNTLKLEGVIKFASGNTKSTTFLFEAKDITKRGKVRFIGENQQITRGKKAFTLTGSVKGRKLISESLNYNYRAKGADGKSVKLYGTIKRK